MLFITAGARPIGGFVFGYLGDRYGRKQALQSAMLGIAVATLLIGFIPSYKRIGASAIAFLIVAKACQNFCFGGEFNNAGIYAVEHSSEHHTGFMGSLVNATALVGGLIASLIGIFSTFSFMPTGSWRFAFIMGGLVGLIGFYFRKNLYEVPHFRQASLHHRSFQSLLKTHPFSLLAGFFIGGFIVIPFTTVMMFANPVLMSQGYLTAHQLMLIQTLLIAFAIGMIIVAGKLADKFSPLKLMQCGAVGLALFSYPLLLVMDTHHLPWVITAELGLIFICELLFGPSNAFLKSIFHSDFRCRGSSLSFSSGIAILGAITPVVEAKLYHWSGRFSTASLWLVLIAVGAILSLRAASKANVVASQI